MFFGYGESEEFVTELLLRWVETPPVFFVSHQGSVVFSDNQRPLMISRGFSSQFLGVVLVEEDSVPRL